MLTFDYLERRLFAKVEHAYGVSIFDSLKKLEAKGMARIFPKRQ